MRSRRCHSRSGRRHRRSRRHHSRSERRHSRSRRCHRRSRRCHRQIGRQRVRLQRKGLRHAAQSIIGLNIGKRVKVVCGYTKLELSPLGQSIFANHWLWFSHSVKNEFFIIAIRTVSPWTIPIVHKICQSVDKFRVGQRLIQKAALFIPAKIQVEYEVVRKIVPGALTQHRPYKEQKGVKRLLPGTFEMAGIACNGAMRLDVVVHWTIRSFAIKNRFHDYSILEAAGASLGFQKLGVVLLFRDSGLVMCYVFFHCDLPFRETRSR